MRKEWNRHNSGGSRRVGILPGSTCQTWAKTGADPGENPRLGTDALQEVRYAGTIFASKIKGIIMGETNIEKTSIRRRWLVGIPLGLAILCLSAVGIIFLANQSLPDPTTLTNTLTGEDKTRAEEALHLMASLGGQAWPGLDDSLPMILWNDAFAFLINAEEALPGWERLDNQTVNGLPVYVQEHTANYQAFAEMLPNSQYAGSMATKDATNLEFVRLFEENLPPFLAKIFPYRLILITSDHYITALVHETFHAYQAENYPTRFKDSEGTYQTDREYKLWFSNNSEAWQSEMKILIDAVEETDPADQIDLVKDFLATRDERRSENRLAPSLILHEKRFEWLEGTSKYVELEIWRLADASASYQPVTGMENDPDFDGYGKYSRRWKNELTNAQNAAEGGGDSLFYYSGMLQARLLDQLLPGWKTRMGEPGVWLEDLLREAVQ